MELAFLQCQVRLVLELYQRANCSHSGDNLRTPSLLGSPSLPLNSSTGKAVGTWAGLLVQVLAFICTAEQD